MEKHLVFFDVDGTTLHNNTEIREADVEAMRRLKQAGHMLFLNTGRSRAVLPDALLQAVEFDGFVCGSTYVEYRGKVLHRACLDDETLRGFCLWAKESGVALLLEGETAAYGIHGGCFHPCIDITEALEACMEEPSTLRITKITADCKIPTRVSSRFPNMRCINFGAYSEQIVGGYDKAFGMRMLCEKTGVPKARTVAFGDSVNDIEMLDFAAKGVIMPEAPATLEAHAHFRATVAEGIEQIFFGEDK